MGRLICMIIVSLLPLSLLSNQETIHPKTYFSDQSLDCIHFSDNPNINEWIMNFPFSEYHQHTINNYGAFWIDDVDDGIKGLLKAGGIWESHIRNLILKYTKPGSIALDLGAHIGTHSLTMSRAVGAEGKVIVFEPQPKIFRELFANMILNHCSNVIFYNCGVSDQKGKMSLQPLVNGNEGGTSLAPITVETQKTVSVIPIDLLELNGVSLIKIDVERMEDFVLSGARKTILNNMPVILIEIMGGFASNITAGPIRSDVLRTIRNLESMHYQVQHLGGNDFLALPIK